MNIISLRPTVPTRESHSERATAPSNSEQQPDAPFADVLAGATSGQGETANADDTTGASPAPSADEPTPVIGAEGGPSAKEASKIAPRHRAEHAVATANGHTNDNQPSSNSTATEPAELPTTIARTLPGVLVPATTSTNAFASEAAGSHRGGAIRVAATGTTPPATRGAPSTGAEDSAPREALSVSNPAPSRTAAAAASTSTTRPVPAAEPAELMSAAKSPAGAPPNSATTRHGATVTDVTSTEHETTGDGTSGDGKPGDDARSPVAIPSSRADTLHHASDEPTEAPAHGAEETIASGAAHVANAPAPSSTTAPSSATAPTPTASPLAASVPLGAIASEGAAHPTTSSSGSLPGVASQLVDVLSGLRNTPSGSQSVTIALYPEGLGAVRATITLNDGQLLVRLAPTSADGESAIRSALPDLHSGLAGDGERQTLVFLQSPTTGGGGDGRQNAGAGEQPAERDPGLSGGAAVRDNPGGAAEALTPEPSSTSALLDLRL